MFVSEIRLLAVIVLYKKQVEQCSSLTSLLESYSQTQNINLKVLVHDNTPGMQNPALPAGVEYRRSEKNTGITLAYNDAIHIANNEKYEWLLTLDQDSVLPNDYLLRFSQVVIAVTPQVGVIVPRVRQNGQTLSPGVITNGCSVKQVAVPDGISHNISAINSGSIWRVDSLIRIGGFNQLFWLDLLDVWAFHALAEAGELVYVMAGVFIEHELTLTDRNGMNRARFENYVNALSAYYDMYGSVMRRIDLTIHLTGTLVAQILRREDPAVCRITLNCLWRRIVSKRENRIAWWKENVAVFRAQLEK